LKKVDDVMGLQKSESNIPENASIKAEMEAAPHTEKVFSEEEELQEEKLDKKGKKDESNIPENASIKAEAEKAESTEKVFSSEKKIDKDAPAGRQVEIALQKKACEEQETEEEEEEAEEMPEKKEKKEAGDKMMKSAGLTETDMDVFDVTPVLKNLKKSYDVMASDLASVKAQNAEMIELFKSLLTVEVKGFQLQKSMASAIETYSATPNTPKGRVSILHKSFEQNQEVAQEGPTVAEFCDRLTKSIESGKGNYNDLSNMISAAVVTESLTPAQVAMYNQLK
jgi:hypothetical protein